MKFLKIFQVYLTPLAQLAKMGVDKKISQESVKIVHSYIDKIYQVNQRLFSDITRRLTDSVDVDQLFIGDLFVELVS